MHLSEGEKLILVMISDIYQHLKLDRLDAKLIREAISTGNTWAIPWDPDAVLDEVVDILRMWEYIEHGYQRLAPADRERVAKEVDDPVKFNGLGGDDDSQHVRVASFLINHMDRYENLKGRPLANSGYPIERHRRMLRAFDPLRIGRRPPHLTADQIITIFRVGSSI